MHSSKVPIIASLCIRQSTRGGETNFEVTLQGSTSGCVQPWPVDSRPSSPPYGAGIAVGGGSGTVRKVVPCSGAGAARGGCEGEGVKMPPAATTATDFQPQTDVMNRIKGLENVTDDLNDIWGFPLGLRVIAKETCNA